MLNSSAVQNKRVFQLRQENPESKSKTPSLVIPIHLHNIQMNKNDQELHRRMQDHNSQQQRVVTSACLPPHQKVHAIQLFKTDDDTPSTHTTRLHNSMIDTNKSLNSSFLPPINPSSGSLKKKKKINFISNAVAALTNNNRGSSSNIFNRSQSSSTPNSRNSSPMRRQPTETSPGNRISLDDKARQSPESSKKEPSGFRATSLFSKSSSNPALTEKHNRSTSHPSPSPTRHKVSSSSPSRKQNVPKQNVDNASKPLHSFRRMSLPLTKNPPTKQTQQLQQKSKPTCDDVWQIGVQHRPQRSEPSSDSRMLLLVPTNQTFIQSQRVLSRVKSAVQGPNIANSSYFSDDEKSQVHRNLPAICRKKENIYEEIDLPLKREIRYDAPITMTTSCYQSPSLSSSSSSSSFFLNGRTDSHSGEHLEKIRINQRSLDDGYSSQECQNPSYKRNHNPNNEHGSCTGMVTSSNRLPRTVDVMTGSAGSEHVADNGRVRLERHYSMDGKSNSTWHQDQNGYLDPTQDNESSSDDCNIEANQKHSSDCKPPLMDHNIANMALSNHLHRPNNVRLGSRCGLLPPRKVQSLIGAYQTLPKTGNGGNNDFFFAERGFRHDPEVMCLHGDGNELRRLRMLIWKERKNNEEREAEVERRWVARLEGVVAEARSIEQSLRNQLQQLRKQFVHLQGQLRKTQEMNRLRVPSFEVSTQTSHSKDAIIMSSGFIDYKTLLDKNFETSKERKQSFNSSCNSVDESATSGIVVVPATHATTENEMTFRHMRNELETCKAAMEEEQVRWMNEKNSVIEYQQRLQMNYIQAMKKNELLTEELHQLSANLERFHQRQQNDDNE